MAPKRKSRPSVLNPRRSADLESVRTRKIARLLKELGPVNEMRGRTRSMTRKLLRASSAIQAAARRAQRITFTVTFNYDLYNPVHGVSYPSSTISEPITDFPRNVHKYLIDENGALVKNVGPTTSPINTAILDWIQS